MVVLDFKSVGERANAKKFQPEPNQVPLGIKTPLRLGTKNDGIFSMHFNVGDLIQDNYRNLLLTNHGERLGRYDFGANLQELSMELGQENFDAQAISRISIATSKYMPFIEPRTFESTLKPNKNSNVDRVDILITYDVPRLEITKKMIQVSIFAGG